MNTQAINLARAATTRPLSHTEADVIVKALSNGSGLPQSAIDIVDAAYQQMSNGDKQNYLVVVFYTGAEKYTLSLQREEGVTLAEHQSALKTAANDLLLALAEYANGDATLSYVLAYADYVKELLR